MGKDVIRAFDSLHPPCLIVPTFPIDNGTKDMSFVTNLRDQLYEAILQTPCWSSSGYDSDVEIQISMGDAVKMVNEAFAWFGAPGMRHLEALIQISQADDFYEELKQLDDAKHALDKWKHVQPVNGAFSAYIGCTALKRQSSTAYSTFEYNMGAIHFLENLTEVMAQVDEGISEFAQMILAIDGPWKRWTRVATTEERVHYFMRQELKVKRHTYVGFLCVARSLQLACILINPGIVCVLPLAQRHCMSYRVRKGEYSD